MKRLWILILGISICIVSGIVFYFIYTGQLNSDKSIKYTAHQKIPFNRMQYNYTSATVDQRNYLPHLLSATKRIEIRTHQKFGKKAIAVIKRKTEILSIVNSTYISKVADDRTATFGPILVLFTLKSGQVIVLEYLYSDDRGMSYIRYKNPWKVLAYPPENFSRQLSKYID